LAWIYTLGYTFRLDQPVVWLESIEDTARVFIARAGRELQAAN